MQNHPLRSLLLLLSAFVLCFRLTGQIPSPEEVFGFRVGADYKLADYDQMLDYYQRLDAATDRVELLDIGTSVAGRPIKLLLISSEENLRNKDRFKNISADLAKARIDEATAKNHAKEGKAVVWFDGGMHASEKAHAQMTSELAWRIAAEESDEMNKIRENVIVVMVPVINPDGVDIVVDWYRQQLGTPYETTNPPILYQKFVGHDNNRDWFMLNMPETRAATKVLYHEWFPQIVHNHHQTSPAWARIFLPPFRSPVNPNIHPGVTTAVNLIGTAMANRFAMLDMPGVISQTNFSMWWNGGMRTAPYFHNMIGILTETAHATPTPRYYDPAKKPSSVGGMRSDGTEIWYPFPWPGGESHFRDAVDYMIESSMALLDMAASRKEAFLYNIYKMGRDAINNPKEAFAYVFSPDQWDRSETRELINILIRGGLEAHVAKTGFEVNGQNFSEGTVIFYGAQAFRPYLVDLMEKQNYPDEFEYPGGPRVPPYDLAGWTLPMQMGVDVVRVDQTFEVAADRLEGLLEVTPGTVSGSSKEGYWLAARENAAFRAVNELQQSGADIYRLREPIVQDGKEWDAGTFLVTGKKVASLVEAQAGANGLEFVASSNMPTDKIDKLDQIKIGIYKSWVANMDEGWTRWVMLQHSFDLDTLHDADFRSRDLSVYQAIIIPSQSPARILHGHPEGTMPDPFTGGLELEGVMAIKKYVEKGGTLITFDEASDFAIEHLGLPVRNVTANLSSREFFVPGSLIRAKLSAADPLSWGMRNEFAVSFSDSRAFEVTKPRKTGEGGVENTPDPPSPDAKVVVQYADKDILMSGWAAGENRYLKDKAALITCGYGSGKVVLFGFRPQFRGQPRGTYKLIFNAILEACK